MARKKIQKKQRLRRDVAIKSMKAKSSLDEDLKVEDLFQLFRSSDPRKIEKALITFASISLEPDSPNFMSYYDPQLISQIVQASKRI